MRSTIFLLFFCICSCSHPTKSWELLFLENVMIREEGLYVLMGSKPMSTFCIYDGFPETAEEIESYYKVCLSAQKNSNSKEVLDHDTFVKDCQSSKYLRHQKMWTAAQEMLKTEIGPRYRFVMRKNPFGEKKGGLFINVPNTLLALQQYYQEFAKIFGADFEPRKVLDEISDENSLFWECIFQSNYAQGLLFGYGRQNSIEFSWQTENGVSLPQLRNQESPILKENVKVTDLRLPTISTYSLGDEILEKYRKERILILKEFQGKNFEEVVRDWLGRGTKK